MPDDLIARLRNGCPHRYVGDGSDNLECDAVAANKLMDEAADEIERLRNLLKVIDERDTDHNLFDCPSGGWIRQQLKAILIRAQSSNQNPPGGG